jgi:predicted ATPase/DNA-binding SARP family transcriptional activator
MLRIALLGPPEIFWMGQPLTLLRRQARALLYRIAAGPHPVPRDQLGFLLWPDHPETTARRNLTVLLTQLRRMVPLTDVLVTADDAVGLNRAAVWSDTVAFTEGVAAALREGRIDQLSAVVNLYRDPFLHGFTLPATEYEAWADQERQTWERRYLDALAALIEAQVTSGAYQAAIAAAQRYLATDDLAEDVHRRLIELYAAIGYRTAAMRQFERCVVVLERELGVGPLPETRAIYEAIRDGRHVLYEQQVSGPVTSPRSVPFWRAASDTQQPDHSSRGEGAAAQASSTTLPMPAGPLIGRAAEVAAARALLERPEVRLVTLCGPGGSGKTRLALQLAWDVRDSFADGVVFVPLAPLRDPDRVIDAIAQACGLQETGALCRAAALRTYLQDKHLLLLLDNFEHLLPAAPMVADLLAAAPDLHILVTSRIVLNLSGEQTLPVSPLSLPDLARLPPPAELAQQPAVALLLARTRANTPSFQLSERNAAEIAAICVQLDGLPLAIELAAARLKVLSPQALLKRLDHRLALLDHGPRDLPNRQRSLRAAIEWSERLLDLRTQRLFERLAVFSGGWTFGAAEEICCDGDHPQSALDELQALLESSLIVQVSGTDGEPRFDMLETIREYALERLRERGYEWAVRRRHAVYFCRFAGLQAPSMHSAEIAAADRDYHNMRMALDWSIHAGEQEIAARIVGSLLWYWDTRGLIEEGRSWNAQVRRLNAALRPSLHARLRAQAGYLAYRHGQPEEAAGLAATVVADAQATVEDRALALRVVGMAALETDDVFRARQHFDHALAFAQDHGLLRDVAGAQFNLGLLFLIRGELTHAEAMFWTNYTYWEQEQHPRYTGVALVALGFIAVLRGDLEQASALLQDGLQQLIQSGDMPYLVYGLLACSVLATRQQRPQEAAALFGAATRHAENAGLRFVRELWVLTQRQVEQAREQLAAEEFDRALQDGRSLSFDQAVALALSLIEATAAKDVTHDLSGRPLGN